MHCLLFISPTKLSDRTVIMIQQFISLAVKQNCMIPKKSDEQVTNSVL